MEQHVDPRPMGARDPGPPQTVEVALLASQGAAGEAKALSLQELEVPIRITFPVISTYSNAQKECRYQEFTNGPLVRRALEKKQKIPHWLAK